MLKKLFLTGLADFIEDVPVEITYADYAAYQLNQGREINVEPINFPQQIEYEFSNSTIMD